MWQKIQNTTSSALTENWAIFKKAVKFSSVSKILGFPGGAVVESLPANAGDTGSSPGLGRSHMPQSN